MERKEQHCNICNDETIHMIGKKQATQKSGSYTRRTTSMCCRCGTKEIMNTKKGRRIIKGKNESSENNTSKSEVNHG